MDEKQVIQVHHGDVTGDRVPDIVYLTAVQTAGSSFLQQITLVVQDRRTGGSFRLLLPENTGYNPTVFLGDFTGNGVKDILVVTDTGGSGGTVYAYVYSYAGGRFYLIFDTALFNKQTQYSVQYKNDYKAEVTSRQPAKRYILDLTTKGAAYLNEIYNPDGTLKQPVEGWVSPLSGLYPIDFDRNGVYELNAWQGIAGRYNADRLGYVQNVLKWNERAFQIEEQYVSIWGEEKE
ncbi:hypothetical protein RRU94_12235 [Domibacillus sp. DTU_2020_1001157_1_SI_ALB_TIR_016]|uniref:hypothetical protein n=1 Tax=Domibacillus sp. DTU_2020_1001157_1_SI_ALB_TIR_016 TaxID=3077789 RepID=UPI0028ED8D25|nr:hypothetical protein [Domibacillus sp. DTU_2020_1001157_1_SI_ALB_TIR_016]WNS81557.1 hypothetical protein RRU94_12235 [Domibacillus sp. DTU_2020_1001157_1_SI_ALB_TIR_016]